MSEHLTDEKIEAAESKGMSRRGGQQASSGKTYSQKPRTPGPEGLCPSGGLPPAAPGYQSASPCWLAIMRVLVSLNSHLHFTTHTGSTLMQGHHAKLKGTVTCVANPGKLKYKRPKSWI